MLTGMQQYGTHWRKKKVQGEKKEATKDEEVKDPAMEQIRERMARIDAFLNMIPAPHLLGFDHPVIKKEKQNLDPGKAKTTAMLLMEAAEWDASGQAAEAAEQVGKRFKTKTTATGKKKKIVQGKKRKLKGAAEALEQRKQRDPFTAEGHSRQELHEKLEAKLKELREERRKKQTEADKALAAQRRATFEAANTAGGFDVKRHKGEAKAGEAKAGEAKAHKARGLEEKRARLEAESAGTKQPEGEAPAAKRAKASQGPAAAKPPEAEAKKAKASEAPAREEVKAPSKEPVKAKGAAKQPQRVTEDDNDGGPEIGRIVFEPTSAELPFEARLNPAGEKMRRMRSLLRKQEVEAEKLKRATDRGEGEELRSSIAMQKALLRVQGHKVRDDTRKLRQAQRSMEVKRKKGREKREQQQEDVRREQEERQMRRKENLQKRSANKKKGRRSGFEGMRDGFLNAEVPAVAK